MTIAIIIAGLLAFSWSLYVSYDYHATIQVLSLFSKEKSNLDVRDIIIIFVSPVLVALLFILALVK